MVNSFCTFLIFAMLLPSSRFKSRQGSEMMTATSSLSNHAPEEQRFVVYQQDDGIKWLNSRRSMPISRPVLLSMARVAKTNDQ